MNAAAGKLLATLPDKLKPAGRRGEGIRIAILDTWPVIQNSKDKLGLIRLFRGFLDATGANHRLLDGFADGMIVPPKRIHDYVDKSSLAAICSRGRNCDGRYEPEYRSADHGLFIADILNNLAPNAEISVYRVLNDFGVLHFYSLAKAVEQAIYDADGQPLVINLSLGFGAELLMLDELLKDPLVPYKDPERWAQMSHRKASAGRDEAAERDALQHPAMKALTHLFAFNSTPLRANVLAVAAAGNDTCGHGRMRVAPRFPASVKGVLGVSAIARDGKVASYSNDNDITDPPDDGIGAFGGEINHTTGLSAGGPIGLYISDNLPHANLYGFARWSGTSFATPVVAGLAACVWSEIGPPNLPAVGPAYAPGEQPENLLAAIVGPVGNPNDQIDLMQKEPQRLDQA